jgi:hypothetical protein
MAPSVEQEQAKKAGTSSAAHSKERVFLIFNLLHPYYGFDMAGVSFFPKKTHWRLTSQKEIDKVVSKIMGRR